MGSILYPFLVLNPLLCNFESFPIPLHHPDCAYVCVHVCVCMQVVCSVMWVLLAKEMTANVRQNLNHAFLHSHSLFALAVEACLGQSAGGWGPWSKAEQPSWGSGCVAAKLPEFLAANHGLLNEPSLRSAEPVSQHTDPWTKTNVYHMPLSFWGWLLCSIIWT